MYKYAHGKITDDGEFDDIQIQDNKKTFTLNLTSSSIELDPSNYLTPAEIKSGYVCFFSIKSKHKDTNPLKSTYKDTVTFAGVNLMASSKFVLAGSLEDISIYGINGFNFQQNEISNISNIKFVKFYEADKPNAFNSIFKNCNLSGSFSTTTNDNTISVLDENYFRNAFYGNAFTDIDNFFNMFTDNLQISGKACFLSAFENNKQLTKIESLTKVYHGVNHLYTHTFTSMFQRM